MINPGPGLLSQRGEEWMKTGIGFWLRPMLRYSLREHEKRFVRGSEPQIHSAD